MHVAAISCFPPEKISNHSLTGEIFENAKKKSEITRKVDSTNKD